MNFSIDSFNYGYRDMSEIANNDFGQRFVNQRHKIKLLSGSLEFATQSEQETLDNMFINHGISQPLWVILDSNSNAIVDGQFKLSMYCYIDSISNWTSNGGKHYSASIQTSEVV
jgi:hypothetical protein